MTWAIRVLITMTSPFLASFGSLTRGFSAMIFSSIHAFLKFRSAAAAADGHLDLLLLGEELPLAGLRHHDDVLGRGHADTGRDLGASRQRREMEGGETRARIAFRHH